MHPCQLESCMGMSAGLNAHDFCFEARDACKRRGILAGAAERKEAGAIWRPPPPARPRPRHPHRRRPVVACSGASSVHLPCGMAPCCTAWLRSSINLSFLRPFTCSKGGQQHHDTLRSLLETPGRPLHQQTRAAAAASAPAQSPAPVAAHPKVALAKPQLPLHLHHRLLQLVAPAGAAVGREGGRL